MVDGQESLAEEEWLTKISLKKLKPPGRGRRVERRQGKCSASFFSSKQAGLCPVNENFDKGKEVEAEPIRWMAALRHASPWPRHPVSRQV